MYLLGEQPAYADKLISRLQSIPRQILEGLQPCGDCIEVTQSSNLAAELIDNQLFLIESGLIHSLVDNQPIFYLQEGDLLGLRQGLDLPVCQYSSEENIRLTPYSRREVFKHIASCDERQELFTLYLLGHSALFTDALARLKQPKLLLPSTPVLLSKVMLKLGLTVKRSVKLRKMKFLVQWRSSLKNDAQQQ